MPLPTSERRQFLSLWASMTGASAVGLSGCSGGDGDGPPTASGPGGPADPSSPVAPVDGPAWWGFARDAQHSAQGSAATQDMARIVWRAPVDLAPQYRNTAIPQYRKEGAMLIHYGSPVVTNRNTVMVPVKTGATGGVRVEPRNRS